MVTAFLVGICLALGQHILYTRLHHRNEDDEDKKVRMVLYGRALAYFSKVAFGGCVILCYRQRIWRTFRERPLSVWSIDQLFLATEDPSLFVNWETLSKAPLAVAMALIIWLIPLATIIFSPGALSFGWYFEISSSNISVPSLNFSAESYKDWRKPVIMADGTKKKSLMFYNTTDAQAASEGWFDYYDKPSSDLTRISLMTAYSGTTSSLNRPDARFESCGGNYNCTFSTTFIGPGYKCEEMASGIGDSGRLVEFGAPFNTSMLVPEGRNVYYADIDIGEYARPQSDNLSSQGGVPLGPIPEELGVFKVEPLLWIGYSINSSERLPDNSPYAVNWTHRYDPRIFRCVHYETRYTVKWNYTEPFFATEVSHDFVAPVIDTNFTRNADGTVNFDDPGPAENFISPRTDVLLYKKISAYHAMGQSLRNFLRGKLELEAPIPGPSYARVYSDITQTRLVSNVSSTPLDNLPDLIQAFYADMVLSLFSAPQMLVVSEQWAEVNRTRYQSTFIYHPEKLWGCYAPVIFLTFIILLLGAWTIWQDGTTWSVGFSRIMVTTRNSTLDDISRGACLGNDPFPLELMHTRLQFGVLNEFSEIEYMAMEGLQGVGHCAFGVPSELSPIRKGVPYAGLKRRSERRAAFKEKVD
ncbi:hypothetical protein BU26DRAFT_426836 [Trematosphaeria pertusa]|uniref:Uncharacterized protein n=1 Tax=Trematosphaeria pertusa TaxID=390896 RepID=A0A6A6IGQ0_9PLEO|nr:uncharacterized protein BU26DRAFT_426836 [Trematosphaeria pertusa]KAF2249208.1 hypothetical protein BU26DRAFT_426836 [Trematosphaeria pertusa]